MRKPMRIVVDFPCVLTDRDRHGNRRYYYRRAEGEPKIRLRGEPGTAGFQAAYEAAKVAAETPRPASAPVPARLMPPKAGTYRWLCTEYFASSEFARLNPSTQRVRRGVLELTFEEPIAPGDRLLFADFPLARMTAKAVRVLRDRKADRPDAANNRLKFVRQVFAWGVEHDHVETNPALGIATIRVATEGYHSWTPTEVTQFEQRHPLGTTAHLALKLALLTGLRRSDLVRVGRQHERNGWLKLTLQKNRGRRPVVVELPILPTLQAVLDASPVGDLTFLATSFGRPFTAAGFGNWFRDRCNEAGLPHCSAHGLRKAGATLAAEQGATTHELMAIFGWLTMRQAEIYTRTAQRKRMAGEAMNLLVRREAK
jgi:integrase